MACTECGAEIPECRILCCDCCKKICSSGFHFLTEYCDLIGTIGTNRATLELIVTDKVFVDGHLKIDGLAKVAVEGFLYDDGSLELAMENTVVDDSHLGVPIPTRMVPALAGVFDRRTFSGYAKPSYGPAVSDFSFAVARYLATRPPSGSSVARRV